MSDLIGYLAGSIGGSAASAAFSARQAKDQMAFQERLSNTAYQRAAKDLEAAGLNRVLALGNPASTPSGGMGVAPDFGASFVQGTNARNQSMIAKEQKALLMEQQAVAKSAVNKNDADAQLALMGTLEKEQNILTSRENAEMMKSQAALNNQNARLAAAEAEKAQITKGVYKALGPLAEKFFNWLPGAVENSAKAVQQQLEKIDQNLKDPLGAVSRNWAEAAAPTAKEASEKIFFHQLFQQGGSRYLRKWLEQ